MSFFVKKSFFNKYIISILIILVFVPIHIPANANYKVNNLNSETKAKNVKVGDSLIKIMSYNIQESGINREWINVVEEENADIMMLEETGNWDDNNNQGLNDALSKLNSYFANKNPYNGYTDQDATYSTSGIAVLSRYPILSVDEVQYGKLDSGSTIYPTHDFIHAKINVSNVIVHVIGAHLKCCSGTSNEELRNNAQEMINNYMDDLGTVPIIYMGDLNTQSAQDTKFTSDFNLGTSVIDMLINSDNPKTTKKHVWEDVWRTLDPNTYGPTYVSSSYNSRIDYIFANQFLFGRFSGATVGDTASAASGSDHYSVDAFLSLNSSLTNVITSKSTSLDTSNSLLTSSSESTPNASFGFAPFLAMIFLQAAFVGLKRKKKT